MIAYGTGRYGTRENPDFHVSDSERMARVKDRLLDGYTRIRYSLLANRYSLLVQTQTFMFQTAKECRTERRGLHDSDKRGARPVRLDVPSDHSCDTGSNLPYS